MTFMEDAEKALEGITPGPWERLQTGCASDPYANMEIKPLMGFRTVAELSLDDAPVEDFNCEQRANARLIAAAPMLLRQAITEVRERDEHITKLTFVNNELKAELEEEYADFNRLKAETAKLREAVRAVLDDACPAEQGDETLVKSHLVSDLRAALTESKG